MHHASRSPFNTQAADSAAQPRSRARQVSAPMWLPALHTKGTELPRPGAYIGVVTELLAALLGAIVGGALSAWIGSRQTARVLKHETDLAAAERREAQRVDDDRRRTFAADQLISALADFATMPTDDHDWSASFVRVSSTAEAHRDRNARVSTLLQASSSHAHALPVELRPRWDALTWMVRFNNSRQLERASDLRRRDAHDLLNYIEYVRQSLSALGGDHTALPHFPAPDVRRKGDRPWGYEPEEGGDEFDLTQWHRSTRLLGRVKFTTGEERWYGPNGLVVELADDPHDIDQAGD